MKKTLYYESWLQHLVVDSNRTIAGADHIRYLGVTIERHLRWNKHIDIFVEKLSFLLSRFRYIKDYPTVAMDIRGEFLTCTYC